MILPSRFLTKHQSQVGIPTLTKVINGKIPYRIVRALKCTCIFMSLDPIECRCALARRGVFPSGADKQMRNLALAMI